MRIAITGVAGRMGVAVVQAAADATSARISGGWVRRGSAAEGKDLGLLAHSGSNAVHRRITTAQYHHTLALQVHVVLGILRETQIVVYVADHVGQGLVDTGQVLAGKITAHIRVGSHPHEHRVELV